MTEDDTVRKYSDSGMMLLVRSFGFSTPRRARRDAEVRDPLSWHCVRRRSMRMVLRMRTLSQGFLSSSVARWRSWRTMLLSISFMKTHSAISASATRMGEDCDYASRAHDCSTIISLSTMPVRNDFTLSGSSIWRAGWMMVGNSVQR